MNTNYYSKYLKYKEKYLELKKELEGGGPKDFVLLRVELIRHEYINKLGPKKIIATPNSGSEPKKFIDMWNKLDNENKDHLTKNIYPKQFGWVLGVFVKQPPPDSGNPIIFYADEYLDLLARASGKTKDELLEIFSVAQFDNPYNLDLIKIAFGDIFGNGVDSGPLETIEGQQVLDDYLDGLVEVERKVKSNKKI